MLREMQINEFDTVFELMSEAFPPTERRPKESQKALLKKENYHIYVWETDGRIAGFLALWKLDGFLFLEHLATDPSVRNQGIGRRILESVRQSTSQRIVLEVEPPENELARRRVGFYERNGFTFNPYAYLQPPMADGYPSIPLHLMSAGGALSPEEFETCRAQIHQNVYGKF